MAQNNPPTGHITAEGKFVWGKYNVTPESITVSGSSDDPFAAYSATERAGTPSPKCQFP